MKILNKKLEDCNSYEERIDYLNQVRIQSKLYISKRERQVRLATPNWADRRAIQVVYRKCRYLNKLWDVNFEVDHVIPLFGSNVCGLHIVENLQLLDGATNLAKSNKT